MSWLLQMTGWQGALGKQPEGPNSGPGRRVVGSWWVGQVFVLLSEVVNFVFGC